jgi:hypothetical protein
MKWQNQMARREINLRERQTRVLRFCVMRSPTNLLQNTRHDKNEEFH